MNGPINAPRVVSSRPSAKRTSSSMKVIGGKIVHKTKPHIVELTQGRLENWSRRNGDATDRETEKSTPKSAAREDGG
jgi:hypothetical protein